MKEKIIAIIPARMGSSRFPGKPLKKINGTPMIQIVYENVRKNKKLSDVLVATCDKVIFDFITSIKGNVIMTSKRHKRASDRCAEALKKIEKKNKTKYDIVVMVQGDEPMINHQMIDQSLKPMLKNKKVNITNLMGAIKNNKDFNDKNFINLVNDKFNRALYLTRSPIPFVNSKKKILIKKQICVIPFRRKFLILYNRLKPTILEKIESIDMLRVIENGFDLHLVNTNYFSHAVDTKQDLLKVERYLRS